MTRRATGRTAQVATFLAALALALSLAGDRGSAATVPAPIYGQDPLEVLALRIKPNVVVILDTSGSMEDTPWGGSPWGGDHPQSKLYLAKQVMKAVFQANQTKAQFLFGNYRYSSDATTARNMNQAIGSKPDRFAYSTMSWGAGTFPNPACTVDSSSCPTPNPTNVTVPVEGPSPSMASTELVLNSLYAFQWIQSTPQVTNNTLVFNEGTLTCTVNVATGFYRTGGDLATAIQNAMNSCTGRANTYAVTYTGSAFRFGSNGNANFTLQWGNAASTIRGVLNAGTANRTVFGTNTWTTGDARINLLQRNASDDINLTYDPDGASTTLTPALDNPSPTRPVRTYFLYAQKFWNGETVYVDSGGNACDIRTGTATTTPTVTLQLTTNCANGAASADATNVATFSWSGGRVTGTGSCQGFKQQVPLIPCDQLSPPQYDGIAPYLDNQLPLDLTGSVKGYSERNDGTGDVLTNPDTGGVLASGNTPMAQSFDDFRLAFANLWNNGQSAPAPVLDPIKNHLNPKERTIVLMVTDGDQNCSPFSLNAYQVNYYRSPYSGGPYSPGTMIGDDAAALGAAAAAQKLYDPAANGTGGGTVNADGTIAGDAAASVTTYVVAFGTGASKTRADWIAWGGSGLNRSLASFSGDDTWSTIPSQAERNACKTCVDSFLAPDAETLRKVLESVIDLGAQSGEFTAQQSVTENVYEYVDRASTGTTTYSADDPDSRYKAITPTLFVSSFTLPGFKGQVKAYQNDGLGNTILKWSAGDKLKDLVTRGTNACDTTSMGGAAGMCTFAMLHGGLDLDPPASGAAIPRRIYTTDRNGVYPFTPATLMAGTASDRLALWPPTSAIAPASYTTQGSLDAALGLPLDSSTQAAADVLSLQQSYGACTGYNLPAGCTSATASVKMRAARREARELILAFMAGAEPVEDTNGIRRTPTTASTPNAILYRARSWVLADSTLATSAVIAPPLPSPALPSVYQDDYKLFRDGARAGGGATGSGTQIKQGFGLNSPDGDGTTASAADSTLKPVMTVLYVAANDMLHAFRGGPSTTPSSTCDAYSTTLTPSGSGYDCGGEELWGFVPFDQLNALGLIYANQPQTRDNHVYVIARGIRFADVFVPAASPMSDVNIGGVTVPGPLLGVWRRIIYFGRGAAGKYLTALDVTAPAAFTATHLTATGPIPLWSRGNPDTQDGTASGTVNNTTADRTAYSHMGQTWSIPSVALVDKTNPVYTTARNGPLDYVLFVGSGYGDTGEGSTFYTLDALSGDVVATADVEATAATYGITRGGLSYSNAIVANPAGFNPSAFNVLQTVHPAESPITRVYVGDIHGRLWKFLTARPDVAIPVADLGADQPIGAAAALLGMPPAAPEPYVYVTSGADTRATGPFKIFGFWDKGTDVDTATAGTATADGITTYEPAVMLFDRTFDQGDPEADCGYTKEALFRGTVQPATTFECPAAGDCSTVLGRVFFAGTRLSPPATKYAPPTPYACGTGDYPCRSQFDSILYALGAKTGTAAYDLNSSGDDAYRIFRDSRIAAITMQADPDPTRGGSSFTPDEGLMKGAPKAPPPPGVPPTATSATANVIMQRQAGQPPPAVRFGSTVCQ
jgi:hypothetical protein